MNFVALLAVLAAGAFTLPLLVQAGEALGMGRGASVAGSLLVAAAFALVFVARSQLGAGRASARSGAAHRRRRLGRVRRRAGSPSAGATRTPAAGLADGQPQALRSGLRLIDTEEDRRAGL